jgi:D-alanine-D-alanine ligase
VKLLILHNAVSSSSAPDDLDTLVQVKAVECGLRDLGHQVETLCFERNEHMKQLLRTAMPEVVFNLVETVDGSARLAHSAPALLEELEIPFTGAAGEPFRLSTGKLSAKALLAEAGVPTPEWHVLGDLADASGPLSGPWLIKSVWEHASLGLEEDSVVSPRTTGELQSEMLSRKSGLGGECFAERYVHGREFNISLLQAGEDPEVLPLAELRFQGWTTERARVVGYKAKWQEDSPEFHATVRSFDFPEDDATLLDRLGRTAVDTWNALELSGYARIDIRVDGAGQPFVIDVNANPCISPDAGFQAAAARAGLTFTQLLERILQSALTSSHCRRQGSERANALP